MRDASNSTRPSTRIPGLDDIRFRALARNFAYLVEGGPGTGKTSLATHFILEGQQEDECCLNVTVSESNSST
jgi:circadian clock protein KaiC